MVVPMIIMVVMVAVTTLFAVLQWVLRLKLQASKINSYRGGFSLAGCNRTSIVMVVPVARVVVMVTMLFAALQRVLRLKLQASKINSYHSGAGITSENCTRLEGSSNIGRNDTNEGKSNKVAEHGELCKCLS